jgi:hypothetical protein
VVRRAFFHDLQIDIIFFNSCDPRIYYIILLRKGVHKNFHIKMI